MNAGLPGPACFGCARCSANYSANDDCVNAAARLENHSRALDCVAVISEDIARKAGADLGRFPTLTISRRGNQASVLTCLVAEPTDIDVGTGGAR